MWVGELVSGMEKAESDINAHNYGRAQQRLHDLIEDVKQNGIVTKARVE